MDEAAAVSREAIRELVARYNLSGDSGRLAELGELFCESAVLEIGTRRYEGRVAIEGMFAAAAAETRDGGAVSYIRHFVATHSIDLATRERASGRCYFLVVTDRGLDHWGRYADEYRRDGERWRFALRRVTVDGQVSGGWAERASARLAR
jgi:hypothetical protein